MELSNTVLNRIDESMRNVMDQVTGIPRGGPEENLAYRLSYSTYWAAELIQSLHDAMIEVLGE